jgi:hypothetical protein
MESDEMKKLEILLLIGLIAIVVCCAARKVKSGHDAATDFSTLKTYAWVPEVLFSDNKPKKAAIDSLISTVDTQLSEKGLKKSAENPDFLVAAIVDREEKLRAADFGLGNKPGNGIHSIYHVKGTLVLTFLDTETAALIWWGTDEAEIDLASTQKIRDQKLNRVIKTILNKFPPKVE